MITLKAAWADIRISTYAMRYFFYNFSLPVYTCGWVLFWFRSLRADDSTSVFAGEEESRMTLRVLYPISPHFEDWYGT